MNILLTIIVTLYIVGTLIYVTTRSLTCNEWNIYDIFIIVTLISYILLLAYSYSNTISLILLTCIYVTITLILVMLSVRYTVRKT